MVEYIIWGIPPGGEMETLLMDTNFGKPITDKKNAEGLVIALKQDHGCTDVRIQSFMPGTPPNFASKKIINI